MYDHFQQQTLNCSLDELWTFIAHPANLNDITPPEMDFTITSDVPQKMYNGLLVKYMVKLPLLGTSEWVTEIKHIIPGRQFIDEQRIGPYAFWYHQHVLEETPNGVRMTDHINYQPPFGPIGKAANALFIRNKLRSIFNYRRRVLNERYNQSRMKPKIIAEK